MAGRLDSYALDTTESWYIWSSFLLAPFFLSFDYIETLDSINSDDDIFDP